MDGLTPAIWFPVVTLILGLALKAIFDLFNERRVEARDARIRIEKRKESIQLQRIENQRKLLLNIQQALAKLMRAVACQHLEDVTNQRLKGEWAKESISEEVSTAVREAFMQVNLLRVQLLEEDLRGQVSTLTSLCTGVTMAKDENESVTNWMSSSVVFDQLNDRIGEVLRSCDSLELAHLRG